MLGRSQLIFYSNLQDKVSATVFTPGETSKRGTQTVSEKSATHLQVKQEKPNICPLISGG